MIIPWGTDAPIYYRPWATIGLIVFTILMFLLTGPPELPAEEAAEGIPVLTDSSPWVLSHGHGLHPVQWVTSNFIHGGVGHLLGNMVFLWGFGLVVEGKMGWWRFLLLYLGLGTVQCASEQVLFLRASGGASFGASAVIYGLLAMCLVWAPRNDFNCLNLFRPSFIARHEVEIPILVFATFYLAVEALFVAMSGFRASSALYHVSGALWGFAIATVMLKYKWVDCEGWDLFSYWRGTHIRRRSSTAEILKQRALEEMARVEELEAAAKSAEGEAGSTNPLENLRQAIAGGHVGAALALYQKVEDGRGTWRPSESDLLALIDLLHKHKQWSRSIPLMEHYLHRFPRNAAAVRIRLRLAQLWIHERSPTQALRVLSEFPPGMPSDAHLQQARLKLEQNARAMCEVGQIDLDAGARGS